MNDAPSPASRQETVSVVVPCYNEETVIRQTHARLSDVLNEVGVPFEIIYVNDGSRDRTLDLLRDLQQHDDSVRIVSLSRNFGHQKALTAGIDLATGDAVVLIDADLQDPPELIPQMLLKWREGYHCVYGTRQSQRSQSALRSLVNKCFYRFLNSIADVPIPLDSADFRLMDRRIVDVLKAMPERDRFLRGMVSWAGFKQVPLRYAREARAAGQSHYPLSKLLQLATDGILSFSLVPLRAAMLLGLAAVTIALFGLVFALISKVATGAWISGGVLAFFGILFLGGMVLGCLGVIGEYVGRIYRELKGRPLYVVEETLGFEPRD